MIELNKKIAILSPALPPGPSGQSIVTYRLLSGISPDNYCLISSDDWVKNSSIDIASSYLPARYYNLNLKTNINPIVTVYKRGKEVLEILRKEKCDALIAFSGDLYDLPAAYLACKDLEIRFVPYIVDWYAYQWSGYRRLFAKFVESVILRGASSTLVPNEYLAKAFQEKYNVQSEVIRHPIPIPDLEQIDRSLNIFNENNVNIVYTGAIYFAHFDAFRNLIAALEKLGRNDVKLHIFTTFSKDYLAKNGIFGANIVFHDHVNISEVARVLRKADILFLPLAFHSLYPEVIRTASPNKIGEYMAVGRPILVHAPSDSFVSWYYKKNGAAMVADENNVDSLLTTLKTLIEDDSLCKSLGDKALKYAREDFEISKIQKRFADIIDLLP